MLWIVTDDIYAETWRRLLEFANLDLTVDQIEKRHGKPSSKSQVENYKKQARQARVCVLQAKEYFDAARASSLFTSPNHAYYGAVALASLMMLILGDGKHSLDVLRSDNTNNHHGLDFTTACTAKTAPDGLKLLEESRVTVCTHGHFANWYRLLPARGAVFAKVTRTLGKDGGLHQVTMEQIGGYDIPLIEQISKAKIPLVDLFKFLPDLDSDLQRFGINSSRARSTHEVIYQADRKVTHTWSLHGCRSAAEREDLLEKFAITPRFADAYSLEGLETSNSAIITLAFELPAEVGFRWPPARDTMSHEAISYARDIETHEVVDLYLIAYQLSMLSRYFPDIWISCIESQCRAAKLIERAVDLLVKKLPILALSFLSARETVISTHRAPWAA